MRPRRAEHQVDRVTRELCRVLLEQLQLEVAFIGERNFLLDILARKIHVLIGNGEHQGLRRLDDRPRFSEVTLILRRLTAQCEGRQLQFATEELTLIDVERTPRDADCYRGHFLEEYA